MANLFRLLDGVREKYEDLLTPEETGYVETLTGVPVDAGRLYTRLIMRRGPLFRSDLLSYDEIASIPVAARDLETAGLLEIDAPHDLVDILNLLRVPELKTLFTEVPGVAPRKSGIIEAVCDTFPEEEIRSRLKSLFSVYRPLRLEVLDTFRLLFFGNARQDLSEFIITELGVVRYESYEISPGNRAFSSRSEVDALSRIYELRERYGEAYREATPADLHVYAAEVPEATGSYHIDRRREGLLNAIARQFERLGDTDSALELYEATRFPPSRERRARIYADLGRESRAMELCNEILDDPGSEEEIDFALGFSRRLGRKIGVESTSASIPEEIPQVVLSLDEPDEAGVEAGALEYLKRLGYDGFYTENGLWSTLFGLAFWDILFLPIPGAFFNQYQRVPSDIGTPDFYRRRRDAIEHRLTSIDRSDDFVRRIYETIDAKCDIANGFVNWRYLDREQLGLALSHIPTRHIRAVLSRIARNPASLTAGFPDLILFSPAKGFTDLIDIPVATSPYLLVEVKGPGDQIQRNQRRWFSFFLNEGIPAIVARVKYGE